MGSTGKQANNNSKLTPNEVIMLRPVWGVAQSQESNRQVEKIGYNDNLNPNTESGMARIIFGKSFSDLTEEQKNRCTDAVMEYKRNADKHGEDKVVDGHTIYSIKYNPNNKQYYLVTDFYGSNTSIMEQYKIKNANHADAASVYLGAAIGTAKFGSQDPLSKKLHKLLTDTTYKTRTSLGYGRDTEVVKSVNGYDITRTKGTRGFYNVILSTNGKATTSMTFRTQKAAEEYIKSLPKK